LLESRQYPYAKEAHDDYLAAITERGALGVLGLTLLFLAVGRRLAWSARDVVSGRRRVHLSMSHTVGCAAAFATSAMFYEVLHFRQLWVFLALLAAHSARGRDGR
jgi:O-antigen ligase